MSPADTFRPDEAVRIINGTFDGMTGRVIAVVRKPGGSEFVRVEVDIFGRPVPVELEPWQLRHSDGSSPPPPRRPVRPLSGRLAVTVPPVEPGAEAAEGSRPEVPSLRDDWPMPERPGPVKPATSRPAWLGAGLATATACLGLVGIVFALVFGGLAVFAYRVSGQEEHASSSFWTGLGVLALDAWIGLAFAVLGLSAAALWQGRGRVLALALAGTVGLLAVAEVCLITYTCMGLSGKPDAIPFVSLPPALASSEGVVRGVRRADAILFVSLPPALGAGYAARVLVAAWHGRGPSASQRQ